jgi:hypothetical protein
MCSGKVCWCASRLKRSNPSPEGMFRLSLPPARSGLLVLLLVLAVSASAQDGANAPATPASPGNELISQLSGRIRGLFDVDLPRFDPPGTYRLQFNPRVGDLVRRDYLRVPVGIRWTIDPRFEINAEAESFFTHNHKAGSAGHGIGELRFGARHLIPEWPRSTDRTSLGLNLEFPVGSPPLDMTDGRNHVIPSLVIERRLPDRPRWTFFTGLSLDLVGDSSVPGTRGLNTPSDDAVVLTGGAVYDLGQIKWTAQATYTTSALSGHDEHIFAVHPSVLWFVPRRFTFNSDTQWVLGLGLRGTWGQDGFNLSTGTRVRAELTFGQAMRQIRDRFTSKH